MVIALDNGGASPYRTRSNLSWRPSVCKVFLDSDIGKIRQQDLETHELEQMDARERLEVVTFTPRFFILFERNLDRDIPNSSSSSLQRAKDQKLQTAQSDIPENS